MKITDFKKSTLAIGILTLVLFTMVGIASAADAVGKQQVGNQSSAVALPAITTKVMTTFTPLPVVGNWNLFYDWSGSGTNYGSEVITFKSDGTFTSSEGPTGKWTQSTDNGMIIWKFDKFVTIYSGNVAGKTMTGIMSNFPPSGVWYAVKQ